MASIRSRNNLWQGSSQEQTRRLNIEVFPPQNWYRPMGHLPTGPDAVRTVAREDTKSMGIIKKVIVLWLWIRHPDPRAEVVRRNRGCLQCKEKVFHQEAAVAAQQSLLYR